MVLLSPRLINRTRTRTSAMLFPGSSRRTAPVPDEGTIGSGRGSSAFTPIPLGMTCSNTRLLLGGRWLISHEITLITAPDANWLAAMLVFGVVTMKRRGDGVTLVVPVIGMINSRCANVVGPERLAKRTRTTI